MKDKKFDAIIVGSGTSAYYTADGLIRAGKTVAIIDQRPFGGTCALRGCQPKKYLVCNAEAVAMTRHLLGRGITDPARTDWPALQALKNEFLDGRSEADLASWQKRGAATYSGQAVMTGPDEITVGKERLSADHIVLATGAVPRRAKIPGSEYIMDSEAFLELKHLPDRIIFIGGGYISFEFAHVAARAGASSVTILHRSDRPLKNFDPDMVKTVVEAGKEEGILVETNESPAMVEQQGGGLILTSESGRTYPADLIIEATGRVPDLSVLSGSAARVKADTSGIAVNEYLQSVSNPTVYAIGDCAAQGPMLATVADEQGKIAAANILKGNHLTMDYAIIPSAVFTIPNLAAVGLTQEAAEQRNLAFRVNTGQATGWPSSRRIGEAHASYKILIEDGSELILGAHLARHNAAESINILALAMKFKIPASELARFLWAYPTMASDLKYMVS